MTRSDYDAVVDAFEHWPRQREYTRETWRWVVVIGGTLLLSTGIAMAFKSMVGQIENDWHRVVLSVAVPFSIRPFGWLCRGLIRRSRIERAIDASRQELYRMKMDRALEQLGVSS